MFREIKDKKEYKGKHPLLSLKETKERLKTNNATLMVMNNTGFLTVFADGSINYLYFPEDEVMALSLCDFGALSGFKGWDETVRNAGIFEKELERLNLEL